MKIRNELLNLKLRSFTSQNLIQFRKTYNLQQKQTIQLLRSTGVDLSEALYSRIENEETAPDVFLLMAICKLLQIDMQLGIIGEIDGSSMTPVKRAGRPCKKRSI